MLLVIQLALAWPANVAADAEVATDPAIATPVLSNEDIQNLYLLGKVWGYLKYHHPRVKSGCLDWDAELLGIAVTVESAGEHNLALEKINAWIDEVNIQDGECDHDNFDELHFAVDGDWKNDVRLLGQTLSEALRSVSVAQEAAVPQHYVSHQSGVRNPQFHHERSYSKLAHLDWRYRLLALYRYWNIIEYWFPYRDVIEDDWDAVLREFIPRLVAAEEDEQYVLELMALIARVQDGHANLWSSIAARPPAGESNVPAIIRFVEGRPFVWRTLSDNPGDGVLLYGDLIVAVDGTPVDELIAEWSPYYGVSNETALLREISRYLLRGDEEEVLVTIERAGTERDVRASRRPVTEAYRTHDRDGDTLQMLSERVAYLKLSSVDSEAARDYIESAAGSDGLIIDIRNYPSSFVVFALGRHLVDGPTEIARFTYGDLGKPGTFRWSGALSLEPESPFYAGRVVILVDERSQSQSEYTAMAFRAAPGAIVVGSQTAGADGNISGIPLPGGHHTTISGIGVFYPDKSPTQKIGIVPDIEILPTIAGLRDGRDEVLEAAVRSILGDSLSEKALREMTRIPHAPPVGP